MGNVLLCCLTIQKVTLIWLRPDLPDIGPKLSFYEMFAGLQSCTKGFESQGYTSFPCLLLVGYMPKSIQHVMQIMTTNMFFRGFVDMTAA
jgi:hypothetical protein